MASSILTQAYASVNDTSVSMPNTRWVRPVTLPAGWKKVRLGVRYHVTFPGYGLSGTPRLGIGLCSGTSAVMGDANVTNAIGIVSPSATWTVGGVGWALLNFAAMSYVGTTITTATGFATAVPWVNTTTPCRQIFLIDIAKGSPNYVVTTFYWNPGLTGDVSTGQFYTAMLIAAPVISGSTYATDTPRAVAFDESVNPLNAINIWWNRYDAVCQVTDVALSVMQV